MGFEPTVRRTYDGFQDRSVMTTSVSLRNCLMMLPQLKRIVNSFFVKNREFFFLLKCCPYVVKKLIKIN